MSAVSEKLESYFVFTHNRDESRVEINQELIVGGDITLLKNVIARDETKVYGYYTTETCNRRSGRGQGILEQTIVRMSRSDIKGKYMSWLSIKRSIPPFTALVRRRKTTSGVTHA